MLSVHVKKLMKLQKGLWKKILALVTTCFIFFNATLAHDVVQDLEKLSKSDAAIVYLKLGFQHIIPLGFDHILFVLSLFLLSPKLKTIMWQSLAFTAAHSVTLSLAMYNFIKPSSQVVEPLIALSIMFVALENIISPKLKASRIGIVFLFGLIHGMGFAGALQEMGLPDNSYLMSLVMFNIGVELGQLAIILSAFFLVAKWIGDKPIYRKAVVIPLSLIIAIIAAYWTVVRII